MSILLRTQQFASRCRVVLRRASRTGRLEKSRRLEIYAELWSQAAAAIGASVEEIGGGLQRVEKGERTAYVHCNYTDLDGPATLRAAGDKLFVHRVLRGAEIPTPRYCEFTLSTLDVAESFTNTHAPCVVKPASGTGAGAGVTTGIRSRRALKQAALLAAGHQRRLLMEQQVAGRNLRLLFLDGELLDAVERQPPTVCGDGKSSIKRLVARENERRRREGSRAAQVFLRRDADMRSTLAEQGLRWGSAPPAGMDVRLKTAVNDNALSDNIEVRELLHEDVVAVAQRAAGALGVRLAGVDILTTDPSLPLDETGGVVLEVNTTPGLYIHRESDPTVAAKILSACLVAAGEQPVCTKPPVRSGEEGQSCRL